MTLPNYTCPKCGAVARIQYRSGCSQSVVDDWMRYKPPAHHWRSLSWHDRLFHLEREVALGERLDAGCPRCAHTWQEKPLDAAPSGTSPIHDAVWAQWGGSTQWGGSA